MPRTSRPSQLLTVDFQPPLVKTGPFGFEILAVAGERGSVEVLMATIDGWRDTAGRSIGGAFIATFSPAGCSHDDWDLDRAKLFVVGKNPSGFRRTSGFLALDFLLFFFW